VARLQNTIDRVFGPGNSLLLNLPSRDTLAPDDDMAGGFTMFMAGNVENVKSAFAAQPEYWLNSERPPDQTSASGFALPPETDRSKWRGRPDWQQFRLTTLNQGNEPKRLATDDWPFLYLRAPMIPDLNLRGAAIMAVLGLLLLAPFVRRRAGDPPLAVPQLAQMFFLGAGFMLVETKAVVHMALLFGGTWIVNSIVIFAVLVMILVANLFVLAVKPSNLWPYYAGLFLSLIVSALVPMDYFLGMERTPQIAGSSLLAFVPILFAGVIFAVSFSKTDAPDLAFGANIAGAMFGGLAEYSSMLLGFQYLLFVAVAIYAASLVGILNTEPRNHGNTEPLVSS
jgi:hypothetical protein